MCPTCPSGALSREAKISLAKGSALAKSAMCSGEGGILPEEMEAAGAYIFEYVANMYSVSPEILQSVDAIEIKIGQGTKPGMGGHLPGEKVTQEIARIRNKPVGGGYHRALPFSGDPDEAGYEELVSQLRMASGGRPIGIKIAAGRIERDLAFCVYAHPDFITIDGRGGATRSSPKLLRDASCVPTVYALHRARKYLDAAGSDISLVITGGLRGVGGRGEGHCHGCGRGGHGLGSSDCHGLPAVPDLRHRHVSRGRGHPGPGSERTAEGGYGGCPGGEFPERDAGGTEDVRQDYGT